MSSAPPEANPQSRATVALIPAFAYIHFMAQLPQTFFAQDSVPSTYARAATYPSGAPSMKPLQSCSWRSMHNYRVPHDAKRARSCRLSTTCTRLVQMRHDTSFTRMNVVRWHIHIMRCTAKPAVSQVPSQQLWWTSRHSNAAPPKMTCSTCTGSMYQPPPSIVGVLTGRSEALDLRIS